MNRNLNLNWIRTFESAARHLSFTAAGKELGLTQTAVSLQIKALETKLGQDLFIRQPKSLRLTGIGKAYLPVVRETLHTLALSTNGLFGPESHTTLVVRASMAFIVWLSSRLHTFQAQHANVSIKLVTAIWIDEADSQNIDVDIVLANEEQVGGDALKLSEEYLVPICSRAQREKIRTPADLLQFPAIHILGFDDHWSRYFALSETPHHNPSTQLMVDTSVAACELVAAGSGCAVVIERFARNAIKSARPICFAGEPVPLRQSHYWVAGAQKVENHAAVAGFKQWLQSQFDNQ